MIPISELFGIFAALALIRPLCYGAIQDLKEFKFSEKHFDSIWVNAAIILTFLMYIALLFEGLWLMAASWVALTVIASLIFSFIGFRFGGGGDWRALCYIAFITPFMLFQVIVASAICGFVQAVYWAWKDHDDDVPWMFRKIPFAVSIFCGYVIALAWMIVTDILLVFL